MARWHSLPGELTSGAMRSRLIGWLGKTLLVLSLSFVTLFLFELLARNMLSLNMKRQIYAKTRDVFNRHSNHLQFDPYIGFVLAPNLRYRLKNLEYEIDISTNSKGFRDDEASLNNPDVVILGDSFVFGSGVTDKATASDVLETILGIRVLNAGIACFGNLQEVRMLEKLREMDLHPSRGTFIFLYPGNDLKDNLGYANSSFMPYVTRVGTEYTVVEPKREDYLTYSLGFEKHRYPGIC